MTNYWGGSSNATTHLLDAMHYRGLLRVGAARGRHPRLRGARRTSRPAATPPRDTRGSTRWSTSWSRKYAPLPAAEPGRAGPAGLRYAVPQWRGELRAARSARARQRLAHARVDGIDWYWPADENAA